MATNRILHVFLNCDMRLSFDGLHALCLDNGIKPHTQGVGSLVVFVNNKKNYIKVLACNGSPQPVIGAYKSAKGEEFDLRLVSYIPRAFNASGKLDMTKVKETFIKDRVLNKD